MIRNRELWEKWEREWMKCEKPSFDTNLRILESLYEHARSLGAFPPTDPLDGIDSKIQIAKAINVSKTA